MKISTYSQDFPRELPVGARQWKTEYGIPFGVAVLKRTVGKDGEGPIQPADLSGSHEAPIRGKLRWYHENFLVLCFF